jgi:hypothetical protein
LNIPVFFGMALTDPHANREAIYINFFNDSRIYFYRSTQDSFCFTSFQRQLP